MTNNNPCFILVLGIGSGSIDAERDIMEWELGVDYREDQIYIIKTSTSAAISSFARGVFNISQSKYHHDILNVKNLVMNLLIGKDPFGNLYSSVNVFGHSFGGAVLNLMYEHLMTLPDYQQLSSEIKSKLNIHTFGSFYLPHKPYEPAFGTVRHWQAIGDVARRVHKLWTTKDEQIIGRSKEMQNNFVYDDKGVIITKYTYLSEYRQDIMLCCFSVFKGDQHIGFTCDTVEKDPGIRRAVRGIAKSLRLIPKKGTTLKNTKGLLIGKSREWNLFYDPLIYAIMRFHGNTNTPNNAETEFKLPDKFEDTKHSSAFNAKLNKLSKQTGFDAWSGNPLISTLFLIYLLHKYNSNCFLHAKPNVESGLVFLFHTKSETDVEAPDDPYDKQNKFIVETLFNCIVRGVDTIIIPLCIEMKDMKTNKLSFHANILIYRKNFSTIEHFEPHGKYYNGEKYISDVIKLKIDISVIQPLNLLLEKNFKRNGNIEGKEPTPQVIHFISSEEICPEIGVQNIIHYSSIAGKPHELGYCAAWSHFFTELALCNPSIRSKDLLEKLYGTFEDKRSLADYFLSMIRGYTRMINAKILTFLDILYGKKLTAEVLYDNLYDNFHNFKDEIGLLVEIELRILNNYEGNINLFLKNDFEKSLDSSVWSNKLNDTHNLDKDIIWEIVHGPNDSIRREILMLDIARKLDKVMISTPLSPNRL